ncbi:MAG: hypothetical protein WBE13_11870 [Candidatus Acidiferrum sp.]
MLAGVTPAVYKALDFDVNLNTIAKNANELKGLHDRFRQAWNVTACGAFADLRKEFDSLMTRRDAARDSSFTPPERFFKQARAKIEAGHYDFAVDEKDSPQLQAGRQS